MGSAGSVESYLSEHWAKDAVLGDIESLNVNGLRAASGRLRLEGSGGPVDLRLVAIRTASDTVDRFVFASPASISQDLAASFKRTIFSYRRLSDREARDAKPFQLRRLKSAARW